MNQNELQHYGIKGMQWDVKKAKSAIVKKITATKNKESVQEKKLSTDLQKTLDQNEYYNEETSKQVFELIGGPPKEYNPPLERIDDKSSIGKYTDGDYIYPGPLAEARRQKWLTDFQVYDPKTKTFAIDRSKINGYKAYRNFMDKKAKRDKAKMMI